MRPRQSVLTKRKAENSPNMNITKAESKNAGRKHEMTEPLEGAEVVVNGIWLHLTGFQAKGSCQPSLSL